MDYKAAYFELQRLVDHIVSTLAVRCPLPAFNFSDDLMPQAAVIEELLMSILEELGVDLPEEDGISITVPHDGTLTS